MRWVVYCWARNVEVTGHTKGGIEVDWGSFGCEVRRAYVHHSGSMAGGEGYGTTIMGACGCLVEDCIYDYNHASCIYYYCAGNVFGYNYVYSTFYNDTWLQSAIIDHSLHPYMVLAEGNIVPQIHGDSYWGSASDNMMFRDHATMVDGRHPGLTQNLVAALLDCWHTNYSFIGCVLATAGFSGSYESAMPLYPNKYIRVLGYDCCNWYSSNHYDPAVESTLLWHGNYDYAHNAAVWDPGITSHDIPSSLYLSVKPSWFGSLPWPGIGPDISGLTNSNPAKHRFDTWWAAGHDPNNIAALFADET